MYQSLSPFSGIVKDGRCFISELSFWSRRKNKKEMDPLETRLSYLINPGPAWGRSTVLDQYQKQSGRMKIFIEDETMYSNFLAKNL